PGPTTQAGPPCPQQPGTPPAGVRLAARPSRPGAGRCGFGQSGPAIDTVTPGAVLAPGREMPGSSLPGVGEQDPRALGTSEVAAASALPVRRTLHRLYGIALSLDDAHYWLDVL